MCVCIFVHVYVHVGDVSVDVYVCICVRLCLFVCLYVMCFYGLLCGIFPLLSVERKMEGKKNKEKLEKGKVKKFSLICNCFHPNLVFFTINQPFTPYPIQVLIFLHFFFSSADNNRHFF